MKTIWKYKLDTKYGEVFSIFIKDEAKILSVQSINNEIFIWAEIETTVIDISHYFIIYPTGSRMFGDIRYNLEFLGTVQLFGGNIINHIYECKPIQ